MNMKTLTEKAAVPEIRTTETKFTIAEEFDKHGGTILPYLVFPHNYKHTETVGTLMFKDLQFDEVQTLMEFHPPEPMVLYKKGNETGVRDATKVPEGADTLAPSDYQLKIDGFEPEISWNTRIGRIIVGMSVKIKGPCLQGGVHNYGDGEISSIDSSQVKIVWPMGDSSQIKFRKYAQATRKSWPSYLCYTGVKKWVDSVVEILNQKGIETQAAYQKDKALGVTPEEARPYPTKLRAGTQKQHEALNTLEARCDYALAQKHWKCYCKEHGIKSRYFSHYDWAMHWLKKVGLFEDNGYKYGSAWL